MARVSKYKIVEGLMGKVPQLSDERLDCACKDSFSHFAYVRYKANRFVGRCMDCAHDFIVEKQDYDKIMGENEKEKGKKIKCPVCGAEISLIQSKKRTITEQNWWALTQAIENWQVVRLFYMHKNVSADRNIKESAVEVGQIWISEKGEKVLAQKWKYMYGDYNFNPFSLYSPMKVRKRNYKYSYSRNVDDLKYSGLYIESLTPQIQRCGISTDNPNTYGLYFDEFVQVILSTPFAETLLKTGRGDLIKEIGRQEWTPNHTKALKIALRHKMDINKNNIIEWRDMVSALIYIDKDIYNPFYVCPDNLKEAHDKWIAMRRKEYLKRQEIEERKRLKSKLDSLKDYNNVYVERMQELLPLKFTEEIEGAYLEIRPLQSIKEFYDEGCMMHHCVFSMEYYKRDYSLILTAIVNGNSTETIEVDLNKYTIVQSRGLCNKPSKYHEQIVALMQNKMGEVRKYRRLQLKRIKNKKTA